MIKWNEVTWYSRLIAIVFFIGVMPAIAFEIGSEIQQIANEANGPVYIETMSPSVAYKQAFLGGQIPSTWSEYGNGFGTSATPISDEKIIASAGGQTYAQHVVDSISPSQIIFSDVPYSRIDTFSITSQLRDKLIAKAQAANTYTTQTISRNSFDVISFNSTTEGSPDAEYIYKTASTSVAKSEFELFIVYPSDTSSFRKGVARYLGTIGSASSQ